MKDNNNETGRDRKIFVFFDELDKILGHNLQRNLKICIVDTSAETEESQEELSVIADASHEEGIDNIAWEDSVDTSREKEQGKEDGETIKEQGNTYTNS